MTLPSPGRRPMTPQPSPAADGTSSPIDRGRTFEPWEREMLTELGRRLRHRRELAGLSRMDLEPVAGSAMSLAAIERGSTRTRESRLRPWLQRLGVPAGEIDALLEEFATVIAPERADGRPSFEPVTFREERHERAERDLGLGLEAAELGLELWRFRVRGDMSRRALGKALRCDQSTVFLVERGARRPSAPLVDRWLRATWATTTREQLAARFPGLIAPGPAQPVSRRPQNSPGTNERPDPAERGDR